MITIALHRITYGPRTRSKGVLTDGGNACFYYSMPRQTIATIDCGPFFSFLRRKNLVVYLYKIQEGKAMGLHYIHVLIKLRYYLSFGARKQRSRMAYFFFILLLQAIKFKGSF